MPSPYQEQMAAESAAVSTLPAESRGPLLSPYQQQMQDEQTGGLGPSAENLQRQTKAGVNVGRTPEEHAAYLKQQGYSDAVIKQSTQSLQLGEEQQKLQTTNRYGTRETALGGVIEQLQRHAVPFSDILPTQLVGKNTAAAQKAQQRYAEGNATPDDIKLIASEGRLEEIDQQMGSTLGGKIVSVMGSAPKILGEMAAGGKLLQAGGKALGIGKAAAPVTLAGEFSPTAARAALTDPTLARVVMTHAGRMAALTPLVPSMWVEEMQQRNLAEGKSANDISNAGPALAHAYSNMLVLGSMQKNFGLTGNLAQRAAVKGGIFAGEQSVADSVYNAVDRQIQGANQFNTKYGTLEHLLKGEVGEAAREATVQAFTGALFAGMHEMGNAPPGEAAKPDRIERVMKPVLDAFAEDMNSLKKTGLSADGASKRLLDMQASIQAEINGEHMNRSLDLQNRMGAALAKADLLTRGEPTTAADVLAKMKLPGTDKPSALAARMAETLKRAEKFAPEQKPAEATPEKPTDLTQTPPPKGTLPPIAPESPTARPEAKTTETPPAQPIVEPAKPTEAAPAEIPAQGGQQTTARPKPALTPQMAKEIWAGLDATEQKNAPKDYKELLFTTAKQGGIDLGKVKAGSGSREQQGDVTPLDPAMKRVIDESDLSAGRKRGVEALMRGASTRYAQKIAKGVSHETLRQDAIRLFGEEPIKAVEAAGQERLRQMSERQTQEGTTAEGLRYNQKPMLDKNGGLLAGFPIKIEALDRLLSDFKPIQWLKRNLLSRGALPEGAFREHNANMGRIAAYARDVQDTAKDFKRAVGDYANLTEPQLKVMNDALGGDQRAMSTLPIEVRDILTRMRDQVDVLSQNLVASNVVDAKLVPVIQGNLGSYLMRQYRVFSDPKWFEKVSDPVKNRFKSWLAAEIQRTQGRAATPDELEGTMKKFLHNDTAADNPISFLSKSKLGSKDLSVLTKRKDVPAELRALWGEYEDPLVNYAHSVAKMSNLLSNHQFLSKVRSMGLAAGFFSDQPTPENFVTVATEGSEVMSPLNGLHTTPEIKQAFEEMYKSEQLPGYLKAYNQIMAVTKYAKTVGSPITHLRNLFGNIGFMIANGHFQMGKAPAAFKAVVNDSQAGRDYYRRLTELGVVGEGVHENEFKSIVNDALGQRDIAAGTTAAAVSGDRITAWVKRGLGLGAKLYHAEDALAKVYAFENEKARYEKAFPTWTPEQVEQKAADIVRRTYPTYSNVPGAVKAIRKFPLIGPFVSFPSEVVRTTYHTAKLAIEEMRDPATRAVGATRLAGLSLSMGMMAGLAATMRAYSNVDWDEEMAMRRFAPEWSKDGQWLHLGKSADGERKYIDLGQTDPHNYLLGPIMAGIRSGSIREGAENVAGAISQPFIGEELAARSLLDIGRNKQEQSGKQVYNPEETTGQKILAGLKHAGKAVTPGAVEQGGRLIDAMTGKVDPKTGRPRDLGEEITADTTGQRVQGIRITESLGFKAKAYKEGLKNAESIFGDVAKAKGTVPDESLQQSYARSEEQRRKVYDEMRADVIAAEKLGTDRGVIMKALKDSGLSADDALRLLNGVYIPDKPTPAKGLAPNEARRRVNVGRAGS